MQDVKILIVEDDPEINRLLTEYLLREGFLVVSVFNGMDAINELSSCSFQLVVLDIMLPKADGYEVLRKIRQSGDIPVLILSARCQETDKIIGLGLGADDYMSKPFSIGELTARVNALLRRYLRFSAGDGEKEERISHLDIEMNTATYEVIVGGRHVSLTAKEFEILKTFMQNPKRVFTKTQLFGAVWGENYLNDENTVMVHIRRLREKIEDYPSKPKYIQTVWGIGYKMVEG